MTSRAFCLLFGLDFVRCIYFYILKSMGSDHMDHARMEVDERALNEVDTLRVSMAKNKLMSLLHGLFLPDQPGSATSLAHPVYRPENGADVEAQQIEEMKANITNFFTRKYDAFANELEGSIALIHEKPTGLRVGRELTHRTSSILSLFKGALDRQAEDLFQLFLEKWKTEGPVSLAIKQAVFTETERQELRQAIAGVQRFFGSYGYLSRLPAETASFATLTEEIELRASMLANLTERHERMSHDRNRLEKQRDRFAVVAALASITALLSFASRTNGVEETPTIDLSQEMAAASTEPALVPESAHTQISTQESHSKKGVCDVWREFTSLAQLESAGCMVAPRPCHDDSDGASVGCLTSTYDLQCSTANLMVTESLPSNPVSIRCTPLDKR